LPVHSFVGEKRLWNSLPFFLLHPKFEEQRWIRGQITMKNFLWVVGGFCAAAAGFIVWGPKRVKPVQELAERLEMAWGDHHTVV
jgi:hypothetical protein